MKQNYLGLKTSFLMVSVYLCLIVTLTSCDEIDPPPLPKPDDKSLDISERLSARIYFDASASMQGFVVPDSTRYKSMLRPLESVITSGWKTGQAAFFRFGEQVRPIDRDGYLMAGSADFYDDMRTYIQRIFEYEDQLSGNNINGNNASDDSMDKNTTPNDVNSNGKENRLVVIVTDLFQDRRDVNLLVSLLKEKYIQNGDEVGLFGLRSEFDGKVYNLGADPILYRGFRPFYLLAIGRHADIAHYFDRLIANGFPDAQTIIFSRCLVNPLLSFKNATIEDLDNLIRDTIAKKSDPVLKEYRITKKDKPSKITAKMNFTLLPHVLQYDFETLDDRITVKHSPNDTPDVTQQAKNCLKITSTLFNNNDGPELSVVFDLVSQSLLDNRIYLYEVTLSPGIDRFKEPEWCSEWDMGDERSGARTLNLANFVRGISEVIDLRHEPIIIGKFHFYIEKR